MSPDLQNERLSVADGWYLQESNQAATASDRLAVGPTATALLAYGLRGHPADRLAEARFAVRPLGDGRFSVWSTVFVRWQGAAA